MPPRDAYNPLIQKTLVSLAAIAILAGIFFRIYHLDRKPLWGDEILGIVRMLGYTEAEVVRAGPFIRTARDVQVYFHLEGPGNEGARPVSATIKALASEDPQHPPFYYVMARLWVAWAGVEPAALRMLPLIFGILGIGAMAWLAFELFHSTRLSLIAASLYAISPFAVLYSQEAREYSFWALETLVSSALFLHAVRSGKRRHWLAYGVSAAIALYTYPLSAFVMVSHAAVVGGSPALRRREIMLPYFLSSAGATILFLPWLYMVSTSATAGHALGTLPYANNTSPLTVAIQFMRDLKSSLVDVGGNHDAFTRAALGALSAALFVTVVYAFARLVLMSFRETSTRFILALLAIPAIPLLLIHGGGLVGQIRYFESSFLPIPLALASWFDATLMDERARAYKPFIGLLSYALIVCMGALSCAASAGAYTWYNKAYQRTPEVAEIINSSAQPLVVADRMKRNDRGTSRVLELGYYLRPGIAMRVNLRCDVCVIPPPASIDVFADADQFQNVFVLGDLKRDIPRGNYAVTRVGTDINPAAVGPLEMFAEYPK